MLYLSAVILLLLLNINKLVLENVDLVIFLTDFLLELRFKFILGSAHTSIGSLFLLQYPLFKLLFLKIIEVLHLRELLIKSNLLLLNLHLVALINFLQFLLKVLSLLIDLHVCLLDELGFHLLKHLHLLKEIKLSSCDLIKRLLGLV